MNNLEELKKYNINYNCKLCNSVNEHLEVCSYCFFKEIGLISKKPRSKWKEIKKITYMVILTFMPAIILGLYVGIKIEYTFCISLIYGMFVNSILNWCMKKF